MGRALCRLLGLLAVSGRQLRRVVSVGAVGGVLARRGGCWGVDNDSEVQVLEALRGERGARDRLWALAAALDAGVVEAAHLRRLNGRLSAIAAAERPEELWRVRVPGDLKGAAAYVCVCSNDEMLSRWLEFELAARLESNLVQGLLPGAGWVSLNVPHRRRWETWDRYGHWIGELPEGFWSRLATHRDARLRAAGAASDPATGPRVLERLADEHRQVPEVLDLVACNPRTPTRVLRRLWRGSCGWPRTDLRVAQNRSAAAGLLGELARSADWELRYVAAWHPKVPVSTLRRLAADESDRVRSAVAYAESAPTEVLEGLASDADVWVRRNLGWNPSTPRAVLEALLGDRLAVVRAAAVANKHTPAALAATRTRDRALRVREQVAWRRGIGAEALTALAEDPKEPVRRAVALNTQTPPTVLDLLAGDSCGSVRAGVAYNASASPATLRVLAQAEDRWLRANVAENPSTPAELLAVLASDRSLNVRSAAALNAAAPLELLAALATDDEWCVRAAVSSNTSAPDLLEVLAKDAHPWVRRRVCDNDEAPQRLVDALGADPDYWVRADAAAACERRRQAAPDTAHRRR